MTTEKKVMVSLGVMCGDAHAGAPLERCLRSVLEKKHGCPVDEVVIGFNGKDTDLVEGTLKRLGYQSIAVQFIGDLESTVDSKEAPSTLSTWTTSNVFNHPPLKLVRYQWPGRFDTARNAYWPHLTGEWLLSMDADDILNDGATEEGLKAIRDLERDYGLEPVNVGTGEKPIGLQQWLATLPPPINVILIGYDYEIDTNGYVLVRQKTKRLVRRSLGHIWHSPDESGIHELLTPVGATPENAITNLGILLRHFPSQSDQERAERNRAVIDSLTKSDIPVEARQAYDTANLQVYAGDLQSGERNLMVAIQQATNDLDRYTYRLAYASLKFQQGNPASALEVCAAAITLNPEFQEAYFLACEASYRMGKWAACIEWYERGLAKAPVLLSRDQPLMRFIQPRGQCADAYLNMANPEKAMKLAKECVERYPKSPLTIWVMDRASQALRADKLASGLVESIDALSEDAPTFAKAIIEMLPHYEATRGIAKSLRARALLTKLTTRTLKRPHIPLESAPVEWEWDDKLSIEDALREARVANSQLLHYEQLAPKKVKVATGRANVPSVAFYSPMAVELWSPSFVETNGLGGSESSLAYLARELSKLGHPVEVYTPHPSGAGAVTLWAGEHRGQKFGVVQKDFTLIHEASKADVLITCRAPYLVREMKEVWGDKPVFCWHQDNGYGNSWLWSKEVIERQQHLHVSKWAMEGLVREGYTGRTALEPRDVVGEFEALTQHMGRHHVLGNGIPLECGEGWDKVERNPHRVIYASDPSRGLEELLAKWPLVREVVPTAELRIFSNFRVMASLKQDLPGLPVVKRIESIRARCKELEPLGVQLVGWQPQPALLEAFKGAGVYAYPGGPMPEGFGVSLVQAQACGLEVVCPDAGALPDVLTSPRVWSLDALIEVLKNPMTHELRSDHSHDAIERHGWPAVAERFLKFVRS